MSKIGVAVVSLLSSAAYLGLAILGLGGFAAFFAHPLLVALVAVTALLVVAAQLSPGNVNPGQREDRGNRWVLVVFAAIGMLDGFFPAYCDRIQFWTFGGDVVRWIGVALFAGGGVLRIWPVFVLGNRFSGLVAIQPEHKLATDGIYGVVRNPSYLGLLVMTLGWGLAFRSGVGVLLAASLAPPLVARIRAEEALLRAQFGSSYDSYCSHTWRLLPYVY